MVSNHGGENVAGKGALDPDEAALAVRNDAHLAIILAVVRLILEVAGRILLTRLLLILLMMLLILVLLLMILVMLRLVLVLIGRRWRRVEVGS